MSDQPAAGDETVSTGDTPPPAGHPATGTTAAPSAGEALSRGGDLLATPGDVVHAVDADPPPSDEDEADPADDGR